MQQGCSTCSTPTNHVRDLNDALDDITIASTNDSTKATINASTNAIINATTKAPIIASTNPSTQAIINASSIVPSNASTNASTNISTAGPQPPPNHLIMRLTAMFKNAIQDNDIFELEGTMKLYTLAFASNLDFALYNCSDLRTPP